MAFAFIFESVGGTEWLLLLGVVLIVVGPKNLPSAARKMGEIMATLRRSADEFKRQLLSMDQEVRRTVEDAVKTDSSEPPSSGMQSGATDENPYPGYEGYEYYDDTQYDRAESEDAPSGEDGGGESVAEASQESYAVSVTS